MTSVQVFGCNGMLGIAVCNAFEQIGINVLRDSTDILSKNVRIWNELVINCAGIVKERIKTPKRFFQVNGCGPHMLAAKCDDIGSRLIHVSTDCVFDGMQGPYSEDDPTKAIDTYGLSKIVGEVIHEPHVTIRTSFIGFGKRGLVQRMINQGWVHASKNFLWSGHTVEYVAQAVVETAQTDVYGILHMPGEFISRLGLVTMIKNELRLDTEIIRDDNFVLDRRLISNRWDDLGLLRFPSLQEQMTNWQK